MRIVIQRVSSANLVVDGEDSDSINQGLVLLVGIEEEDTEEDIHWAMKKVLNMRIFPNQESKMDRSVLDIHGELMIISQFTLYASIKKGNRPSFVKAAKPIFAENLFIKLISMFRQQSIHKVVSGKFGSNMQICLTNDGPVTIMLDSKNKE